MTALTRPLSVTIVVAMTATLLAVVTPTTADAVGSEAYNKRLGLARANAVVSFLAAQGISTSRLEAVVSFGETQPIIVTEGRERRNRRTVTEVSGFVGSHPTVLEGKYAEIIYRDYINSAVPPSQLTTIQGTDFQAGQ